MSNPSLAVRLLPETVRTVAAAAIVAGSPNYVAIGSAFAFPSRQIFLQNLTDVTLMFSLDGVNDHFPLPSNGFFLDDITSNRTENGGALNVAQGTMIYVKEVGAPTTGSVYLSTWYGANTN